MSFADKYPELYQFFGGYFPEADLDGLTDEQVVAQFVAENPKELVSSVQVELTQLLLDQGVWDEVATEANRYFETQDDLLHWLQEVLDDLQTVL